MSAVREATISTEDVFANLHGAPTCTARFSSSPLRNATPDARRTSWRAVRRSTVTPKHNTRNAGAATYETESPLETPPLAAEFQRFSPA